MHPDAEFVPDPEGPPICGHDAIAEHVRTEKERLGASIPKTTHIGLIEREDQVVVFGHITYPRGESDSRWNEIKPVAWRYVVSGDLVARVELYPSWAAARSAAGIPPDAKLTRKLGGGGLFSLVARAGERLRGRITEAPATFPDERMGYSGLSSSSAQLLMQ
jgi:hypothetical protein